MKFTQGSRMRALPPLTALRAFEAAGRLLSFQSAARELALTPTAISHQIRLLEDYCGQALFRNDCLLPSRRVWTVLPKE
jgi:Bacterial regulatory helix-turn-helix protein, lysR family